eukprot:TRINITY_DN10239_c0_g1_i6.p1 TRINITY_DN10239_c0_g1~~TRINITY_DN10239_c0_g1_i6.p1  ORF type:complete len:732 (+),score=174.78 TRINITY_DN10239_c0_g1_i6:31-2226(+)
MQRADIGPLRSGRTPGYGSGYVQHHAREDTEVSAPVFVQNQLESLITQLASPTRGPTDPDMIAQLRTLMESLQTPQQVVGTSTTTAASKTNDVTLATKQPESQDQSSDSSDSDTDQVYDNQASSDPSGPSSSSPSHILPSDLLKDMYISPPVFRHELVGVGAFGRVYRGEWLGAAVALKEVVAEDPASLLAEAVMLKDLLHPNIVQFLGMYRERDMNDAFDEGELYLVTEFVAHGSLADYLRKMRNKQLPLLHVLQMSRDISAGMSLLEKRRIVHRDLAARNILLAPRPGQDSGRTRISLDEHGRTSIAYMAKVSDFGLSRAQNSLTSYYAKAGSLLPLKWSAPEALSHRKFSSASDVWSFGVVVWEMVWPGVLPYPGIDDKKRLLAHLGSGERLRFPGHIPDNLRTLMESCWDMNPKGRPSFNTITRLLDDMIAQIVNPLLIAAPSSHSPYQVGLSSSSSQVSTAGGQEDYYAASDKAQPPHTHESASSIPPSPASSATSPRPSNTPTTPPSSMAPLVFPTAAMTRMASMSPSSSPRALSSSSSSSTLPSPSSHTYDPAPVLPLPPSPSPPLPTLPVPETAVYIRPDDATDSSSDNHTLHLLVGNLHSLARRPGVFDSNLHQWVMFVQGMKNLALDPYVDKVTFNLHPTFQPSVVTLLNEPFSLTRTGWGVFTMHVTITFKRGYLPAAIEIDHDLSFSEGGSQSYYVITLTKNVLQTTVHRPTKTKSAPH